MKILKLTLKSSAALLRLFIALLLLSSALPLMQSGHASSVGLRQNVILEGNVITLGDVFHDLPDRQDEILGAAPRPGHEMVLNARTLMRIAIAMNIPWRPASSADSVTISRAATLIERSTIESALHAAIAERGLTGRYTLIFPDGVPEIVLPQDQPKAVEVSALSIGPDQSRFTATLAAPSTQNPVHTLKIAGRLERMVSIPVLREPIRNGTIISRNDIEFIDIRSGSVNPDTIVNAENLIGMTPRRMLLPGQKINAGEVEPPRIVKRGEIVTVVFARGSLSLTAQGKALEHGSKGDVIRVVNTRSSRTIDAVVTAPGEVAVKDL